MAANYVRKVANNALQRFTQWQTTKQTQSIARPQNALSEMLIKLEPYMVSFQSLLIWENPLLSSMACIVLNCLFWLMVWWTRRFYSIVAIVLFCYHFVNLWTTRIWPEIRVPPNESNDNEGWTPVHPQVLSAPEINRYVNDLIIMINASLEWLIELRRSHRGLFCLLITTALTMTAIVGRIVPGVVIIYALMMTLVLGPGIALYVIPDGWYATICSFLCQRTSNKRREDENDGSDDKHEESLLSERPLRDLSLNAFSPFELNPFEDINDDSSLQLISGSQFNATLDSELGIAESINNDDDIRIFSSDSPSKGNLSPTCSEKSNNSQNGIHFVSTHFSRSSSTEAFEEDYELISDSELQESPKKSYKESSI